MFVLDLGRAGRQGRAGRRQTGRQAGRQAHRQISLSLSSLSLLLFSSLSLLSLLPAFSIALYITNHTTFLLWVLSHLSLSLNSLLLLSFSSLFHACMYSSLFLFSLSLSNKNKNKNFISDFAFGRHLGKAVDDWKVETMDGGRHDGWDSVCLVGVLLCVIWDITKAGICLKEQE